MQSDWEEGRDKFEEEKKALISEAKKGIESNIPMHKIQKKYLKNLLLFSIMSAAKNPAKTSGGLRNAVNNLFKSLFITSIHSKKIIDDDEEEGDGEYLDTERFFYQNLNISMNNIQANPNTVDTRKLAKLISPKNIMRQIKYMIMGFTSPEIIKRIKAMKALKTNHRETPQEMIERMRRTRAYEQTRKKGLSLQVEQTRQNTYVRDFQRERSRS